MKLKNKKADKEPEKDKQGGFKYTKKEDLEKAEHADLGTLPKSIEGTNCSNCEYSDNGFCKHEEVQLPITPRMCCKYWSRKDFLRSWENKDEKSDTNS